MEVNDYKWKRLYEECGGSGGSSSSSSSSSSSYKAKIPASPTTKEGKIKEFAKLTGVDEDEAEEILSEYEWDFTKALLEKGRKKKPKDKKIFKVGDKIICIDFKPSKNMEPWCIEFLQTYKYYTVKDVKENLNIDVGLISPASGQAYFFSPNRFELREGKAPIKKAETGEVVEGGTEMKKEETPYERMKREMKERDILKDEEKKKKIDELLKRRTSTATTDYNPWKTSTGGDEWA
jgi:hypothetical protein